MRKRYFLFTALMFLLQPQISNAAIDLCGNVNSSGTFVPCPAPDKDNNGYNAVSNGGLDCDDTDYRIFPGVITASGCSSGQTRKCQADGTFTSCSSTTVCEAASGSTCKYIDCASGNDSTGTGSFADGRTFANVSYYDNAGLKPPNWYNIQAGDVIYLTGSGTCSQTTNTGSSNRAMLKLNKSGTVGKPITIKRYPGSTLQ